MDENERHDETEMQPLQQLQQQQQQPHHQQQQQHHQQQPHQHQQQYLQQQQGLAVMILSAKKKFHGVSQVAINLVMIALKLNNFSLVVGLRECESKVSDNTV